MKLSVMSKSKNNLCFILIGYPISYCNSLRRIMINEVPTQTIEDIEFRKNSTALYDEIIAHRLGLITLSTDIKSYNFTTDCKCKGEGCAKCTLKLTIKEKCQKNNKTIYASDIKSTDPKVIPVYPKTPIVKLMKDQELEVEASVILGIGKDHAKWSPGHIYYHKSVNISIDNSKINNPQDIIEKIPCNILEIKNKKLVVNNKKLINCTSCEACYDVTNGAIKLNYEKDSLVFHVESWGQLSCKEILVLSLETFNNKLDELNKLIK